MINDSDKNLFSLRLTEEGRAVLRRMIRTGWLSFASALTVTVLYFAVLAGTNIFYLNGGSSLYRRDSATIFYQAGTALTLVFAVGMLVFMARALKQFRIAIQQHDEEAFTRALANLNRHWAFNIVIQSFQIIIIGYQLVQVVKLLMFTFKKG